MSIYLQGKEADLVGMYLDDDDVIEVWQGEDKIWPDETGISGFLIVEPPAKTDANYPYWKHAISQIENGNSNNSKYIMLEVEGQEYYINNAPRGKQKLVLEGNMIKLNAAQQKAFAGKIGEYITLKVKMPARYSAWRNFNARDDASGMLTAKWTEILLPDSAFEVSAFKGQKKEWAYVQMFKATTYPSQTEIAINQNWSIQQQGRYDFTVSSNYISGSQIVSTDNSVELRFNVYGSTGCRQGVAIWFPAFEKEIQLKVIAQS